MTTPCSDSSSAFSADKPVAELRRRPNGAQCIVLANRRDAEDGHHRVSDELLDHAAVPLEHGLHRIEVAPHHASKQLGVESLAERRRARDVGEQNGYDLPFLRMIRASRERRAAGMAVARIGEVLASTGAAQHARQRMPWRAERTSEG